MLCDNTFNFDDDMTRIHFGKWLIADGNYIKKRENNILVHAFIETNNITLINMLL